MAVERKVQASTGVAAVSGMALWILGKYVFKGDVPDVIASWVYVLVPGLLTFAAGYYAKHTHRPDLTSVTVSYTGSKDLPPIPLSEFQRPPGEPPTGLPPAQVP